MSCGGSGFGVDDNGGDLVAGVDVASLDGGKLPCLHLREWQLVGMEGLSGGAT